MNTLLRDLTDSDLEQLRAAVVEEQATRRFLASAQRDADRALARYQEARARNDADDGQPPAWVQPTGAHDAYPLGWVVAHDGTVWESLVSGNVWMPGVSGWREKVADDPETGEPGVPEWVQPTGAHDAYNIGDKVTYGGQVWTSLIDSNVWSPTSYPAGWSAA